MLPTATQLQQPQQPQTWPAPLRFDFADGTELQCSLHANMNTLTSSNSTNELMYDNVVLCDLVACPTSPTNRVQADHQGGKACASYTFTVHRPYLVTVVKAVVKALVVAAGTGWF